MKFTRPDGSPLRDFKTVDDMDDYIIAEHNKRVAPEDEWYFLGDAVINKKHLHKLSQLNGIKTLVPGNHDNQHVKVYLEYFDNVRGYIDYKYEQAIMSHIPVQEDELNRFKLNIHGHKHYNVLNDPRYLNVCVEQLQYAPITLDQAFERAMINKLYFEENGQVINFADRNRNEP